VRDSVAARAATAEVAFTRDRDGWARRRTRADAPAISVLVALGLRALMHTGAIFDWPAVMSWDSVETVAIESRWGAAWQLQVVAAAIFLAASVWAGRERPKTQCEG
jgi:hypothetical protein